MHDAQAVGEARVLGRREDPARALELADPAEPLQPGRVEDVLFGDVLVRQPDRRRLVAGQALGQLDVAVDRVADEVDRRELVALHGAAARTRRGRPDVRGRDVGPQGLGSRTSTSSPHDRTQSRISIVPATVTRQSSEPSGGDLGGLGRVPAGLHDPGRDVRGEAQHDGRRCLVRDDVPGRPQFLGRAGRIGRLEGPRRQGGLRDALDLERPDGAALLVVAHQVQRVRLERRLDEVRTDGRPPGRGPAVVACRLVVDRHDAALRPGLGQQADVLVEGRIPGAVDMMSSVRSTYSASAGGSPTASFSKAAARSGSYLSA